MDPISHALVGATLAGSLRLKTLSQRRAMAIGALAGMSPDLDVLIRSADYPLLALKFHRHFTHAIPVSPFWSLLVAGFFWLLLQKKQPLPFLPLYYVCLIAVIAHGVLDAMTNYGTHLFWPLSPERESWNIISIIDPLFTLPLLLAVILAVRAECRRLLLLATVFMACYWGWGWHQREAAAEILFAQAAQRGHYIEKAEVKPSFGNLWAWRTQYISGGRIYIDAAHASPWAGEIFYQGATMPHITAEAAALATSSPIQQQDLRDFEFFSDGWLAPMPQQPDRFADARFALLPNSTEPLWAVEIYPDAPQRHAGFVNLRRAVTTQDWQQLWAMIRGKKPTDTPAPRPETDGI